MEDFGNKVVYQVYPKSFMDANGDGVGDLKGITGQLDYLKELGIDYLWITPVFPSPQRDNGYDVADYVSIDPRFGTMEDMEELIAEGKKRGIGLMLDMVFNHTSTEHLWFKRALSGEKSTRTTTSLKKERPKSRQQTGSRSLAVRPGNMCLPWENGIFICSMSPRRI